MNQLFSKKLLLALAALMVLTTGAFRFALATPPQTTPPTTGGHGTNRGGSYPVQVAVTLGGKPVAGITVTATAKKDSLTAVTSADGTAVFQLSPGKYTFTATNDSGTAKAKAKVVASTTPLVVPLPLAPKTP